MNCTAARPSAGGISRADGIELGSVATDPNSMPSAREIPPALGRAAVQFMRDGGRANEALAYAYELLRRQASSVDSHRAYLAALGPVGPMPHVADFESAGPGAAVSFIEE